MALNFDEFTDDELVAMRVKAETMGFDNVREAIQDEEMKRMAEHCENIPAHKAN